MLTLSRLLAVVTLLSGVLTLAGYGADIQALTRVRSGFKGMSVVTATTLALLACGVLATTWRRDRFRDWACIGATLLIVPVWASFLVARQDLFSPFVSSVVFGWPAALAGRTALASLVSCSLLTAALAVRRSHPRASDIGAGLVSAIAATALLGYAYGVTDLYALWIYNTMAVHTAASLLLLSASIIFSTPGAGLAWVVAARRAGRAATRLQLAVLLLLPVAGWILLGAIETHRLGVGTAMAMLVVVTVWPLTLLILRDGHTLVELDDERRAKSELQQRLGLELEGRLRAQALDLERAAAERLVTESKLHNAQKMETVGQLTGGIAHDFNNLLMAISGNLQLLRRRLPRDAAEQRYVDNAIVATDKGAKVTGQLLAFSRSQRLSIMPTEIGPVLANARELIGNALGPNIRLQVDGAPDLWAATDADQLELALLNLAVNARDAMPAGGTIRLECAALADDDRIAIRVVDTGAGMSADVAAKAIEPFFTTKPRGKGTGLGLAQVHGFARQCEGDLRIRSEPGVGTTVEILLPRVRRAPAVDEASVATPRQSGPGERLRVLVIDDDRAVRDVVAGSLRDFGFEVGEAVDGVSALAALDAFAPDAIVVDFLMPGLTGAEVARQAQAVRPGLPVVFISGYADTVALDGIAGARVLRKPFKMEELQRALASIAQGDAGSRAVFSDSDFAPPV